MTEELAVEVDAQWLFGSYQHSTSAIQPQAWVIVRQCAGSHVRKMPQDVPAANRSGMHGVEEPVGQVGSRRQREAALALADVHREGQGRRRAHQIVEADRHRRLLEAPKHGFQDR